MTTMRFPFVPTVPLLRQPAELALARIREEESPTPCTCPIMQRHYSQPGHEIHQGNQRACTCEYPHAMALLGLEHCDALDGKCPIATGYPRLAEAEHVLTNALTRYAGCGSEYLKNRLLPA